MRLSPLAFACLPHTAVTLAQLQVPFFSGSDLFDVTFGTGPDNGNRTYEFCWPIKRVAIIGAGVGGLVAYREFSAAGFDVVRVFERDNAPGGNWHYTEDTAGRPPIPDVDPSRADYDPSEGQGKGEERYEDGSEERVEERFRRHRRPRPLFDSLKATSPSVMQEIYEFPWPIGTPLQLTRRYIQRYLRSFATWHEINVGDDSPHIAYNTRVEKVEKRYIDGRHHGWNVTLKSLTKLGSTSSVAKWWQEDFDAVVIASGRFNAPHIPDIHGLEAWAHKFPDSLSHSNQYRRPEPFENQTVLIVGGSVSAIEISRDVNAHAAKVYQSIRSTPGIPEGSNILGRLPVNTTVVPEIKLFGSVDSISGIAQGEIQLFNGTVIKGIDRIIFATGYRYSYPYLEQYHDSSLGPKDRAPAGQPQPLVTDGSHVRSLFLDFLYIEEPTIGVINANKGIDTFELSEHTSLALARIWLGQASIPDQPRLWELHEARVNKSGGYHKRFNNVQPQERLDILRFFVAWLNGAAVRYGGRYLEAPRDYAELGRIWASYRYPGSALPLRLFEEQSLELFDDW